MQDAASIYRFGTWRLDPLRRCLLSAGEPVQLNGRAFDMLVLLVAHRDRVVSRDEIVSHVWAGLAVGDNNLTVQMSTLRNVLERHGDGAPLVVTVPGRGYQFVGEVDQGGAEPPREISVVRDLKPNTEIFHAAAALEKATTGIHVKGRSVRVWKSLFATIAGVTFVIATTVVLTWRVAPIAPRLSIAVLPFRNIGPDHAQDYLADALTDDLTTDLAHIPLSTVIARESANSFRGQAVVSQKIGHALGVRYLVEGSVRLDDDRFRVNAQLVDAPTGRQIWSDRFDTAQGKMSDVKEAIVRHLASSLDFHLAQIESARSLHDRPNDPDAVDLFNRARGLVVGADTSLDILKDAQAKLEQALKQQPEFADAAATLGSILLMKVEDMSDPDETKDMQRAHEVIGQALTLSPHNADALGARARELAAKSRWNDAEYSAKAALTVEPSNVAAYLVLARCARARGDLELAAANMVNVLRIAPDGLTNKRRFLVLGYIRLLQGKIQEALDLLPLAIAGDQDSSGSDVMGRLEVTRLLLVAANQLGGHHDQAHILYEEYAKLWPSRTVWRFSQYYGQTESSQPGFMAMLRALHDAGMPIYADEGDQTPAPNAVCNDDDFGVTPQNIGRGETWTTNKLASQLRSKSPPVVIDVGLGAAIPIGAFQFNWGDTGEDAGDFARRTIDALSQSTEQVPIVVMGDGTFGCESFQVASMLVKTYPNLRIAWFRGGEEAWVSHGLPHTNVRH